MTQLTGATSELNQRDEDTAQKTKGILKHLKCCSYTSSRRQRDRPSLNHLSRHPISPSAPHTGQLSLQLWGTMWAPADVHTASSQCECHRSPQAQTAANTTSRTTPEGTALKAFPPTWRIQPEAQAGQTSVEEGRRTFQVQQTEVGKTDIAEGVLVFTEQNQIARILQPDADQH